MRIAARARHAANGYPADSRKYSRFLSNSAEYERVRGSELQGRHPALPSLVKKRALVLKPIRGFAI